MGIDNVKILRMPGQPRMRKEIVRILIFNFKNAISKVQQKETKGLEIKDKQN